MFRRHIRTQLAAVPVMVMWLALPWRCSLVPDQTPQEPKTKPYEPKTAELPAKRETLNGHHPPVTRRVTVPEEVIVRAMDTGRLGFVRCFKKAVDADPTVLSFKVQLHIELDATGRVTQSSSDATDAGLSNCLLHVAYRLPFPAPGQPAMVDLPLFYRAE